MNDTDRLLAGLRDLPPDLPDPLDRFELVGERVRRRRRRHTAVVMGGTLAVVALAVPLGAQLLPQSAEVGPGGGVDQRSPPGQSPTTRTCCPAGPGSRSSASPSP